MAGRLEVDRVPETHGTVECVEGDRPVTRRCRDAARAARERDAPHVTGMSRSLKAGCGERRPLLRAFIVLAK